MSRLQVVYADPKRLAEAFRQFRLSYWLDCNERWYGGSREEALKHAPSSLLPAEAQAKEETKDD